MEDIRSQELHLGAARIHYYTSGQGEEAVVLLHGGGMDEALLSWRYTLPFLGAHFAVTAPDWPGYGQSEVGAYDLTLEGNAAFLLNFLDALGIERARLVGISLGGGSALQFALDHPQRVSQLVLVDSYGFQSRAPFHRLAYPFIQQDLWVRWTYAWLARSRAMVRWTLGYILANRQAITEDLVEEVYAICRKPGVWKSFYAFQKHEVLPHGLRSVLMERLGELELPVTILHGDRDQAVPLADAQAAAQRLRAGQMVILPNSGHWPQRDHPERFNRVLLACLQGRFADARAAAEGGE